MGSKQFLVADLRMCEYNESYYWTFRENWISRALMQFLPPVLLLVGTVGCILTSIVLLRLRAQIMPSCLYLGFGALVDMLVLWTLCGNDWVINVFSDQEYMVNIKLTAMHINNSVCKIYPFITDFFLHLSIWLIVCLTVETGLAHMRPHRLKKICAYDRARAVVLLTLVLLVCINAHCFWSYALVEDEVHQKMKKCTIFRQGNSETFGKIILPLLNIIVADLLPLCIILSFTIVIITRWRHFNADNFNPPADKNQKPGSNTPSSRLKLRKLVRMDCIKPIHHSIMCICVLYLVLLSPKCVYDIFHFIAASKDGLGLIACSPSLDAKITLAKSLCWLFFYMFLSAKFFILLACVPLFRKHFMELLMCVWCVKKAKKSKSPQSKPLLKSNKNCQPLVKRATGSQDRQVLLKREIYSKDPMTTTV